MNYSWWDVTDTPIQLTDGLTIIGNNISIPVSNTNGSQIQVSPTSSKVFELRRRMISSNGFAIATNNSDAEIQINVEVTINVDIEKTLISNNPVPAGGMTQFQIKINNQTGGNLTNLNISDILDNNLIPSSINVVSNSNINHNTLGQEVEFTILNLQDGETETILYSVQVNSSTPPSTLTNCPINMQFSPTNFIII